MPRAGRWLEEAGGSRSNGSNDVQDLSTMGHVVVGQVTLSHVPPPKWRHPCRLVKSKDKEKDKKREKQCKMSSKKCIEYGEQKNNEKEPETGEPKMKARDLI